MNIPEDGFSDDELRKIYMRYNKIAVLGISRDSSKDSYRVAIFLKDKGYEIIPINPNADYIAGMKVYKNILDVPGEIDILDVFRPSEDIPKIVDDAIKKGVKVVWLQLGIYHPIVEKLKMYGVEVVWNRCMLREYKRLF